MYIVATYTVTLVVLKVLKKFGSDTFGKSIDSRDTSIDTYAIQPYRHTNGSRIDLLSKTTIWEISSVHYTSIEGWFGVHITDIQCKKLGMEKSIIFLIDNYRFL